MARLFIRELFPIALTLFILLIILEWFLPGFATNRINMTAYAIFLIILGIFTAATKIHEREI